jgi:hypothetical protein
MKTEDRLAMTIKDEGVSILVEVRGRKLCDSTCPVFDSCILSALSVKPATVKERICLVNCGTHDQRMAVIHLALGGPSELANEIKRVYLDFQNTAAELELYVKKGGRGTRGFGAKERLMLLKLKDKQMDNLMKLFRTQYGDKITVNNLNAGRKDQSMPIKIVEVTGATVMRDDRPLTDAEVKKFEELEQKVMEKTMPDPDSLVYSEVVRDTVLPSMVVVPPEPVKPVEVKEENIDPVLAKYFPGLRKKKEA